MGTNAKRKTTMAKLNREGRLRERRIEKQMRKDARKLAAAETADGRVEPSQDAAEYAPPASGPESDS